MPLASPASFEAHRIAVDTGGTFTDLAVEGRDGSISVFKSSTTPEDPVRGVLDVVSHAAGDLGKSPEQLLGEAVMFVHGTTRAINAILTRTTARTAFLTTEGHPDVLVFREGGRTGTFDFTRPYPDPYVPRSLTFEVPERIGAGGEVVKPLQQERVARIIDELREAAVEAVGVCLLWSIVNPVHELRIAELLDEHLPGVPYTLSHRVNPAIREYRRASSACIDASLKPVMSEYLRDFAERLRRAKFAGRVLVVTSNGAVMDASEVAERPIHAINSGPSMAPIAGRHVARLDGDSDSAIVADTGGTSYDVSLVRDGRIPTTRDAWIGAPYFGHITGMPSVDVKSVGAGGGSIAWVDEGGVLHVGPDSAGSIPGPVCYDRGGRQPTVTDASLTLGYIDSAYFLGGAMTLDVGAARDALEQRVARPLGLDVLEASSAVIELATEHMVHAIEDITVNQGIDPTSAVLVGGGGAAGLNAIAIARRLGCPQVVIPEVGAVLSAAGALLSDLGAEYEQHFTTTTRAFDQDGVNEVLADLERRCSEFVHSTEGFPGASRIDLFVEARYFDQVWELEVPVRSPRFASSEDVAALCEDFHALHERVFAISSPDAPLELITWRARASRVLREREDEPWRNRPHEAAGGTAGGTTLPAEREVYFPGTGPLPTRVHRLDALAPGTPLEGPAVIESSFSSVVVDPGATGVVTGSGGLSLFPGVRANRPPTTHVTLR